MKSTIKVYEYAKCSTCVKALKFLDKHNIPFERVPIVEHPPTKAELKQMLKHLQSAGKSFKNLFNTSGVQYRELKISEKIKGGMTEAEALELLSQNGKLVKRPFLLTSRGGTVGFQEDQWKKLILS